MKKIKMNKARCKKCGDIIESKSSHDFNFCSCGAVGVDGGHNYIRRAGKIEDCEELSEFEDDVEGKNTSCYFVEPKEPIVYKPLQIDFFIPDILKKYIDEYMENLNTHGGDLADCYEQEIRSILNSYQQDFSEKQINLLHWYYCCGGIYGRSMEELEG